MSAAYELFYKTLEEKQTAINDSRTLASAPATKNLIAILEAQCVTNISGGYSWDKNPTLYINAEKSLEGEWSEIMPLLEEIELTFGVEHRSYDNAESGICRIYHSTLELGSLGEVRFNIKAMIPEGKAKNCRRVLRGYRREQMQPATREWPMYELVCSDDGGSNA